MTFRLIFDISSVKPQYGDIKDELPSITDDPRTTQFRAISTMSMDTNKSVDPNILEIIMKKEGYKGIVVSTRGTSSRMATSKKFEVTGARDVLETIKLMGFLEYTSDQD
ncbi:hypothetical protein LCGC14_2897290, partial [marine sediment metagenome]